MNDLISIAGIAVAVVLVVGLLWAARRANELFAIRVERGVATHIRGRVPPALFSAMAEVVSRPAIERATLRAVSRGQTPALEVDGRVPDYQIQQLRNVLGQFPTARIRSGRLASLR